MTIVLFVLLLYVAGSSASAAPTKCDVHANLPKSLSHITFKGGQGEGCEDAVVIENAKSTVEGVAAEKVWIKTCYPSAHIKTNAVGHKEGRAYDVVEITTENNLTKQLCFDITKFFGSW